MPHVNPVRQPGIVRAADASVTVTQDAAGYLLSAAGSPDNADGLIAARTFLPHNEYLPHANALTWSGAHHGHDAPDERPRREVLSGA